MSDPFILAGKTFQSRLLVGTGRYKDMAETKAVIEASGAEIVTVALRRMIIPAFIAGSGANKEPDPATSAGMGMESIQDALDPKRYTYLPNSAGCHTAEEAVRTLRLARELGGWDLVKLEVIQKNNNLLPDVEQTLEAAKLLVKDGFHVMVYTTDDAITAKKFEELGCAAIMPLASPIGSGLGIQNPDAIAKIIAQSHVPVLVDAGIGTASDACIAMEMGCAGVLLNSALSDAKDSLLMAQAMKYAVIAGRAAFLAGRMPKRAAAASSPQTGLLPGLKA